MQFLFPIVWFWELVVYSNLYWYEELQHYSTPYLSLCAVWRVGVFPWSFLHYKHTLYLLVPISLKSPLLPITSVTVLCGSRARFTAALAFSRLIPLLFLRSHHLAITLSDWLIKVTEFHVLTISDSDSDSFWPVAECHYFSLKYSNTVPLVFAFALLWSCYSPP